MGGYLRHTIFVLSIVTSLVLFVATETAFAKKRKSSTASAAKTTAPKKGPDSEECKTDKVSESCRIPANDPQKALPEDPISAVLPRVDKPRTENSSTGQSPR